MSSQTEFADSSNGDRWLLSRDEDTCETTILMSGTSDGLSLAKSFARIQQPKLRRSIVQLVEAIAAYRG